MGGLFGGGGGQNTSQTPATGVKFQSSVAGLPIPITFGKTRMSPNLIGYYDFIAVPHETSQGGGKGGSSPTNTSYTYTASFLLSLGEGPINIAPLVWIDSNVAVETTSLFTIMNGSYTQSPWSYLTAHHSDEALAYRGIAYAAAANYDLGTSPNLPNHNIEVVGFCSYNFVGAIFDADPRDIVTQLLTNPHWGLPNFPASWISDLTQFSNYCVANGLLFSPSYADQAACAQLLTDLLQICNSAVYFSEGLLKIVPYGDATVSGNGVTFVPFLDPVAYLTDDDFIGDNSADPVIVTRNAIPVTTGSTSDAYNQVQLEFLNRTNNYQAEIACAMDQASIDTYGLRPLSVITAHQIADQAVAQTSAQLILQRILYIRNQYQFQVGWAQCGLEPTDLLCITDSSMGFNNLPVRIISIEEDEDGLLTIVAEDAPPGALSHVHAPVPPVGGYNANYNLPPGSCNPPIVFDAPAGLKESANRELWIGASGGADWGGASVWLSSDGLTYTKFGEVGMAVRQGILQNALLATPDPDTTSVLNVDLTESLSALHGASVTATALLATLCYCDGEFISFQNASLLSQNVYALSTLRRGAFNSSVLPHAAGAQFARIDRDAFLKVPYTSDQMPEPLYVKLTAYNQFGNEEQGLADVSPTMFVLNPAAVIAYDSWLPTPIAPTIYATPDLSGHITRARVTVSFAAGSKGDGIGGLALFLAVFPYENSMTIATGGTGSTLGIANAQLITSGTVTALAGSTTSHIIVTTAGAPLDISVNTGGRWWASLPGSKWRKCTGLDTLGYFFDPPFDVMPTAGMALSYAEIGWADDRVGNAKIALLSDGVTHELIEWSAMDQNGPGSTFQLTGCTRGTEGTMPISADGKKIYYFPAPGAGTRIVPFPDECFTSDGTTFSGLSDINFDIPAGYFCMVSAAVFSAKPDGSFVRSALVPVVYGGPL